MELLLEILSELRVVVKAGPGADPVVPRHSGCRLGPAGGPWGQDAIARSDEFVALHGLHLSKDDDINDGCPDWLISCWMLLSTEKNTCFHVASDDDPG